MSAGIIDLSYEIYGEDRQPVIVFLHGFMGSGVDWRPFISSLPGYKVVLIDLPGHGKSISQDSRPYAMGNVAERIDKLLDRLSIERCYLSGYSMGGRLALYMALEYPARFLKVALESASPGLTDPHERKSRREHDEALAKELENGNLDDFVDRWYSMPMFATLQGLPGFKGLLIRRLHNNRHGLATSLRSIGTGSQPPLWQKLRQLVIPTVHLVGERDPKFCAIASAMAEHTSQIQVVKIADAGHNVHFEKPEEFIRIILHHFDASQSF